ncbi:hypothetical protein VCHC50A2_2179B, partial [Vibrio cholerae HC-50A2]
STSQEIAAGY